MGQRAGAQGLAWAGVVAISVNALATLVWARLRFAGPALVVVGGTLLRSGGVALVSALVGDFCVQRTAAGSGALGALAIGAMAYLLTALALGALVGEVAVRNVFLARLRGRAEADA